MPLTSVQQLLALDTSGDCCSVAVINRGRVVSKTRLAPRQHSSHILPMLREALVEAQLTLSSLDCIAFGHGPGSFTGLRLAASTVQGLAYPWQIPIMGISIFQAVAQELWETKKITRVVIVQDARKGELYLGKYTLQAGRMAALDQDCLVEASRLSLASYAQEFTLVRVGEVIPVGLANGELIQVVCQPQAYYIAQLALDNVSRGKQGAEVAKALPIYLRDKIVSLL